MWNIILGGLSWDTFKMFLNFMDSQVRSFAPIKFNYFSIFLTHILKQSHWLQTQINILHNRRWSASLRFENVIDEPADVTSSAS